MGQFNHLKKVVCHAGHNFSGFMVIKKGIGKRFQMRKQVGPHPGLHVYAHHMSLVLDKIVEHHFDKVEQKKRQAEDYNHPVLTFRDQGIQHGPRYNRIYHTDG